jgi:4'-phosphopantetheinyl transferase
MIFLSAVPVAIINDRAAAKWLNETDLQIPTTVPETRARRNSRLGRTCLRALLFCITGKAGWIFRTDPQGKPFVLSACGTAGPHISLSHTHGMIAVALSPTHPLGVDVEYHRHRDFAALAAYAFGPDEQHYVAQGGAPAFYKIWTLREAIAKATGEGLPSAADGRSRIAAPQRDGAWSEAAWNLFYTRPDAEHSLALATRGQADWNDGKITVLPAASLL